MKCRKGPQFFLTNSQLYAVVPKNAKITGKEKDFAFFE